MFRLHPVTPHHVPMEEELGIVPYTHWILVLDSGMDSFIFGKMARFFSQIMGCQVAFNLVHCALFFIHSMVPLFYILCFLKNIRE